MLLPERLRLLCPVASQGGLSQSHARAPLGARVLPHGKGTHPDKPLLLQRDKVCKTMGLACWQSSPNMGVHHHDSELGRGETESGCVPSHEGDPQFYRSERILISNVSP